MTTYVLGAGASVHAGYPLTKDLAPLLRTWVNENARTNGRCRDAVNALFGIYGDHFNVEEAITNLSDCQSEPASSLPRGLAPDILGGLRDSIKEYFDSIANGEAVLYARLAAELISRRDAVLTFNYDLGIERKLKKLRVWEAGDGYGFVAVRALAQQRPSQVLVLKLHGSTNWLKIPFNGQKMGQFDGASLGRRPVVENLHNLGYDRELRDDDLPRLRSFGSSVSVILPEQKKRFYSMTSTGEELREFWDRLWSLAADALSASQKVVIIGYSMPAADKEARDLLLEQPRKSAHIVICCGSRNGALSEEFKSKDFHNVTVPPGKGRFEDFLECPALVCA
jgi:hypothetical protein